MRGNCFNDAFMGNVDMTPEGKVKKFVTATLRDNGVYYFFPVTGGFGTSGIPDIIGCYRGMFFGLECKAGDNKPTALQENQMRTIRTAGGSTLVVNEENMGGVMAWLRVEYQLFVNNIRSKA